MRILIAVILLITSLGAKSEIARLECVYEDGKYPITLTIDYSGQKVTTYSGTIRPAKITEGQVEWLEFIDGEVTHFEANTLDRYTGILKSSVVEKIIKKDGQVETKEFFHLPRKCNVAKNRKF